MYLQGNLQGVQHLGLPVLDIEKAKKWYTEMLDFNVESEVLVPTDGGNVEVAFISLGNLVLELYQLVGSDLDEIRGRSAGHIDHFSIQVANLDDALKLLQSRGASLAPPTLDGPIFCKEFWDAGARFAFFEGPTGEKVELCERIGAAHPDGRPNIRDWEHLGVPVADLEKTKKFYAAFGFTEIMSAAIPVSGGHHLISMMEKDGFAIEFFQLTDEEVAEIRTRGDGLVDHISLNVADVDRAFAELREAGFSTLEESPVDMDAWEHGVRFFNVRGPDGEKVEFNQVLEQRR